MYETADALNNGRYFWNALSGAWPIPFEIEAVDSAVLDFASEKLIIVVCKQDRLDGLDRRSIQVTDRVDDALVLEVLVGPDMQFLHGASGQLLLDEVGAVDTLMLLLPPYGGLWTCTDDVEADEEEHHV